MRKLSFKEKVKWRFRIDDTRIDDLQEAANSILQTIQDIETQLKKRSRNRR